MAGARALLRAAGVERIRLRQADHRRRQQLHRIRPRPHPPRSRRRIVSDAISEAGGIPREFNTIAVDDGIAMGHGGMLYSLPSRDLIADSVEYMVNAHCADALVCISNCDKITPGMLMAALRLNIPTVFVSGGPMEGGTRGPGGRHRPQRLNLISAMPTPSTTVSRRGPAAHRGSRLPDLRLVLGHVHRQLDELPHRSARPRAAGQRHHTGHAHRPQARSTRTPGAASWTSPTATTTATTSRCCRGPSPTRAAFENAMTMDIAMGGSTNTVLHLLAAAQEAELDFTLEDIDAISRKTPCLTKVAPNGDYLVEDVHRAGGIPAILGELDRGGMLHHDVRSVHAGDWATGWTTGTSAAAKPPEPPSSCSTRRPAASAPRRPSPSPSAGTPWTPTRERLHPRRRARHPWRAVWPCSGATSRGWLCGEDRRRGRIHLHVLRPGRRVRIAGDAVEAILSKRIVAGDVVVIRYEGPRGGPGMQEMLYPTSFLKGRVLARSAR